MIAQILAALSGFAAALRAFFDNRAAARLKKAGEDAEKLKQWERDDAKSSEIVRAGQPLHDDDNVLRDDGFGRG